MPAIAVLYFFGWVFAVLAAAMLVPLGAAIAFGDGPRLVGAFLITFILLVFLAGAIMIALRGRQAGRNRRAGLLLLGAIWGLVPLAAALPFQLSGVLPDFYSAYFEAVSGFTTTGATVFPKLEGVPKSIILWRAELQWLGGAATYFALALILGPLAGPNQIDWELKLIGGSRLQFADQVVESFNTIMPIYAGLTLYCFLALLLSGIASFDAFCLTLSAVSTGGFMPRDGDIILYGSPIAELVLAIFMFFGAVSLIWLRAILRFQWASVRATPEPFWIGAAILLLTFLAMAFKLAHVPTTLSLGGVFHEFTTAVATAASLISTSGFIIADKEFAYLPYVLLLVGALVGGGRFSTAGGLKFFRLAAMFRQSWREFKVLIFPHGVRPNRFGGHREDAELMKSVWATFALVITASWMLALFLAANMTGSGAAIAGKVAAVPPLDVPGAFMAAVSAISNIGPAYNMLAASPGQSLPEFFQFTPLAKLAYCAGMILGRVEILALLAFFNIGYWRS